MSTIFNHYQSQGSVTSGCTLRTSNPNTSEVTPRFITRVKGKIGRSSGSPLNIHLTSTLTQLFYYFASFFVPSTSLTHAILEVVLHCLIMLKLSVDLNEPKDSSKTGRTPKSLTLEIHHGGWFTPTPSRSYIGGHVSSVSVVDIDEFCLHDLKDMAVKLGYGVEDLMYCHFLIPSLGLDYGLHSLNVDANVLEMSNPDVNRNVRKEWEDQLYKRVLLILLMMVVHVGTSSTADDFSFRKFKEEGNDTSGSDSEDLDYDPKHDDVFDDDEHIVEEVHVNMNNFSFTADPKHDTSIGGVDVQDVDLDVIDYDSFGSDLDDEIDSERRIQLRELRRIGKQKTRVPISITST
ncbi:hypothetical protein Tco_0626623 [Tanacetum coccineum]|uniref:PB1-like domain-containing protein n=1 Tax=Tanacetum coccineum TaxID=301880 RepID=A0ABQ4WK34_9ASTR